MVLLKPGVLNFSKEDTDTSSTKDRLTRAKNLLYEQAQNGDSHDSHRLILFVRVDFENFKLFMQSIEINDPIRIKKEWDIFWKSAALWDPGFYFHKYGEEKDGTIFGLKSARAGEASVLPFPQQKTPSEKAGRGESSENDLQTPPPAGINESVLLSFPVAGEVRTNKRGGGENDKTDKVYNLDGNLEFLSKQSPARYLAEQGGHPHFQLLMGAIDLNRGDISSAVRFLDEAGQAGYHPALYFKAVWHFSFSFQTLLKLSEKDYAPAKKLLGLLADNRQAAEEFVRQYNSDGLKPHLPKFGHSRTFFQRWGDMWRRDISFVEREAEVFDDSVLFNEGLESLTKGFELLHSLSAQNNSMAITLRDNFSERVRLLENIPFHRPNKELNQKCSDVFRVYFKPERNRRR